MIYKQIVNFLENEMYLSIGCDFFPTITSLIQSSLNH